MPEKQFQDPVPQNRPAPQPVPDPKPGNYCAARDGFRRMTNIQNITPSTDAIASGAVENAMIPSKE